MRYDEKGMSTRSKVESWSYNYPLQKKKKNYASLWGRCGVAVGSLLARSYDSTASVDGGHRGAALWSSAMLDHGCVR